MKERFRVEYEVASKKKHAVVSAETQEQATDFALRMLESLYPASNSNISVVKEEGNVSV